MRAPSRYRRAAKVATAASASALLLAPALANPAYADVFNSSAPDVPLLTSVDPQDLTEFPGVGAYGQYSVVDGSPDQIAAEILDDPSLMFTPGEDSLLSSEQNVGIGLPVRAKPADQSVYLSWSPPLFKDASMYQIVGWESDNPANQLPTQSVSLPRVSFTGLDNGVDYTFYVVGYGLSGNTVYRYVDATPVGIAPMPSSPPRLVSSDDSSITVSLRPLRDRTVTGYQVKATEVATGNEYTATTTETSRPTVKVTGLKPNTEYELVYAGMSTLSGNVVLGPYSAASLTVVTNDTTAPTSVAVTSERNSRVDLSWDAVDGATKYIVYYDEVSDPYGEEFTIEVPGTSASVTGLTNGTDYEFEVAAEIERDGKLIVGDRSDPVYGTPAGPLPPSDFRINHPANGAMFFDWNAVSGVEGYMIATEVFDARGVDNPNVPDPVFIAAHDGEMDAKVEGLTNDVEYRFRIASVLDGEPGTYTNDENSPLGVPMGVPGTTDPVVTEVTATSITVTYPAPPVTEGTSRATKYEVTFTPANGEPVALEAVSTSVTADGLTEGVTYTVSVRAGNKAGMGPPSPNPIQVTTAGKAGMVQNLEVTRTGDGAGANLTWDAPAPDPSTSAPSAYKVDARPLQAGDPDPGQQTVTGTSASFSGLAAAGDYEFTVVGVTGAGDGPVATVGSIGVAPAANPVSYDYDNNSVSFTFPAAPGMYTSQARATQQATPGDAALTAAIRDGKADQLIDNQLAVVDPTSLICADGTCTAVFENFADNLNGEAWTFQARFVGGDVFASNWANAAVTSVADAAEVTRVGSKDTKAPCLPDAVETPDGKCREFMNYTYSTETQTQPYTYTQQTKTVPCAGADCPGSTWNFTPEPCTFGTYHKDGPQGTGCYWWSAGQKQVTVQVKDAPPVGWYDNGTAYAKDTSVKDPTPEGWTDDGSRWTRVVEPFSSECPASTVLQPDGSCREFQDYTFSTKTETQPYSYHQETRTESCAGADCPGSTFNYTPLPCTYGTLHPDGCYWWSEGSRQVTVNVKDAPPAGWYDNGSAYARDYQEKDPTPEGWTDDGTQWYRDVSSSIMEDYFIESTFAWDSTNRATNGVVNMMVNGNLATDGKSKMLGRCPGEVAVALVGLAGSTTASYELCN